MSGALTHAARPLTQADAPHGDDGPRWRPGRIIMAPFPRLQGKRRPGLVVLTVERTAAGRCDSLVAIPMTSRRAGSQRRLPVRISGRLSWLLPGFAAILSPSAATLTSKVVSEEDLESALVALADIHGTNWRRRQPPIAAPPPRPRLLSAAKRGLRIAGA